MRTVHPFWKPHRGDPSSLDLAFICNSSCGRWPQLFCDTQRALDPLHVLNGSGHLLLWIPRSCVITATRYCSPRTMDPTEHSRNKWESRMGIVSSLMCPSRPRYSPHFAWSGVLAIGLSQGARDRTVSCQRPYRCRCKRGHAFPFDTAWLHSAIGRPVP